MAKQKKVEPELSLFDAGMQKTVPTEVVAILDDKTELRIGDEVTTNYKAEFFNKVLIIDNMQEHSCKSGYMCQAYVKDEPGLRITGSYGNWGIDANWFKKVVK